MTEVVIKIEEYADRVKAGLETYDDAQRVYDDIALALNKIYNAMSYIDNVEYDNARNLERFLRGELIEDAY